MKIYKPLWLNNQTQNICCSSTRLTLTFLLGNTSVHWSHREPRNSQLFPPCPLHRSGRDNSAWEKKNKIRMEITIFYMKSKLLQEPFLQTQQSSMVQFRRVTATVVMLHCFLPKGLTWNVAKLSWLRFTHEEFLGKRLKYLAWFPVSNLEGHKEMFDCGWRSKFQIIVSFFSIL